MNIMVEIFPMVGDFRRCRLFVDLLYNFHSLKHVTCFLVGLSFKVLFLQVKMFSPVFGNGVEKDLVELFRFLILGVT